MEKIEKVSMLTNIITDFANKAEMESSKKKPQLKFSDNEVKISARVSKKSSVQNMIKNKLQEDEDLLKSSLQGSMKQSSEDRKPK